MSLAPVDIAGAGAFGTALAITLARAGHPVTLWARADAQTLEASRENARRLPGHTLPDGLRVTSDFKALTADTLLVAVPTQALDTFLEAYIPQARTIVSTAKGLHLKSGLFPTGLIAKYAPSAVLAQLTGPSFAQDIARGLPTALTLACADETTAKALQHRLSTPTLRLYRTHDVLGAEIGGALKNVIAIACGACIGEGMGDSTRAAVMTRGFAEMTRFASALGADPDTLTGLSGLGDLALTCGSELSRNFRFGLALGRQEPFSDPATVEGVATAKAVAAMAKARGIDMPIVSEVATMTDGNYSVAEAIQWLLSRPLKPE